MAEEKEKVAVLTCPFCAGAWRGFPWLGSSLCHRIMQGSVDVGARAVVSGVETFLKCAEAVGLAPEVAQSGTFSVFGTFFPIERR